MKNLRKLRTLKGNSSMINNVNSNAALKKLQSMHTFKMQILHGLGTLRIKINNKQE